MWFGKLKIPAILDVYGEASGFCWPPRTRRNNKTTQSM